jgi:hypothetical protein
MLRHTWISTAYGVALIGAAVGCAPLNVAHKSSNPLPHGRLPADAVVLDLVFARVRAADSDAYESIWDAADEQRLGADARSALANNGLRVGVLGQQLPPRLRELIDASAKLLPQLSEGQPDEINLSGSRQHLPVRAGHRTVVTASKVFPSLPLLLSENGNVHGHQLNDARCTLSLKAYPQADGRVKLSIVPEIEHGQLKERWGGSEGMMIQQTSQERLTLDRLAFEAVLTPGQTLLLSTTPEIKGLGEYYFSQQSGGAVDRRLLLIRFSQTQFDGLFAPEQTSAPLATPGG